MNFKILRDKINDFLFEDDPENENAITTPKTANKPAKDMDAKKEPEKPMLKSDPIEAKTEKEPPQPIFINTSPKKETAEAKPPVEVKKPEVTKVPEFCEPYELKEIISPFYGITKEEPKPIKQTKKISKTASTVKKDAIISPYYGYDDKTANEMREDNKTLYRKEKKTVAKKTQRRKTPAQKDSVPVAVEKTNTLSEN